MARELLDEERVAARLGVDRGDGAGRRVAADQLRDLALVHAVQAHARQLAPALELGEQLRQRVPRLQLGVAERADDQDRPELLLLGDVAGEQQRGPVGPVEVVDDHQHRPVRREPAHDGHDGAEQLAALRLRVAGGRQPGEPGQALVDLGQQPGQLGRAAHELGELVLRHAGQARPQHVDPGPEREQLLLVAAAVEHLEGGHPVRQLRDDPGLADPALAADEHDPGLARGGALGALAQAAQRRVAADPVGGQRLGEPVRQAGRPRACGPGPSSWACSARVASPGAVPSSSRNSTRRDS